MPDGGPCPARSDDHRRVRQLGRGKNTIVGDADFDAAASIVDAITPVPGGVGAVTSAVLMRHVVQAAERTLEGGKL